MKVSTCMLLLALVGCGRHHITDGVNGTNGQDGYSVVANSGLLSANDTCPAGGSVTTLYKDVNRNNSVDLGIDQPMTSFIVCNGLKGDTGSNGATGSQGIAGQNGTSSIISVIDLKHDVCGESSSNFSEVVLKLDDGRYLSSFSDNFAGDNTRFTILVKGINYSTTDGNGCTFTLNSNNELVRL